MKKFFKKVFDTIRTGIAWLLVIPFAIAVILLVFFGVLIGITSNTVFEKVGGKLGTYTSKSEKELDAKIVEYRELKIDLQELLDRAEKDTGQQ